VGLIGGIFQVSKGLRDRFGEDRVRDTPISSRPSWGWGWDGGGGMRPIVEIQIWDFIAMTMDQIVNQAAKIRYMLGAAPPCRGDPRPAGRRHSSRRPALQSLEAWFAHVPGLVVIAPPLPTTPRGFSPRHSRRQPVIFLEHKMLYPIKGEVPAATTSSRWESRHQARGNGRDRGGDPDDGAAGASVAGDLEKEGCPWRSSIRALSYPWTRTRSSTP
jgi:pyruvate/2-oxoglutarate/acetoin dehydrogenase E1 component